MSKKRPGVEASLRLLKQVKNVGLWEQVEQQLRDVIIPAEAKKKKTPKTKSIDFGKLEQYHQTDMRNNTMGKNNKCYITKDDLVNKVIPWKFTVGKPRYALMKHIESNSNANIMKYSQEAIQMGLSINKNHKNDTHKIKESIELLSKHLKGIGPATASVILSGHVPQTFCYMYDEVIDCFEPKRDYTVPVYLRMNQECTKVAQQLNNNNDDGCSSWTPCRVSKVLWTAARVFTIDKEQDLTVQKDGKTAKTKVKNKNASIKGAATTPKKNKRKTTSTTATEGNEDDDAATSTTMEEEEEEVSKVATTSKMCPRKKVTSKVVPKRKSKRRKIG